MSKITHTPNSTAATPADTTAYPILQWTEADQPRSARWRSENGSAPPRRVVIADDTLTADAAYRLACEGTGMLWRGDFQNARQLLLALARRADSKPERSSKKRKQALLPPPAPIESFHLHRQAQSQRARTLGMLLLPFEADHSVPLRRAPDVQEACTEAYGHADEPYVASLRELLGLVGAHEWRKKGVEIPALAGLKSKGLQPRIHPHYGVFSPVRGEYVELVAKMMLPSLLASDSRAFDIGTGTGVLAAVLAQRGISRIIATEQEPRALACARDNMTRLDLRTQVEIVEVDLFPEGRAPLVVCNPPWLPARPNSTIEHAVYDPESRMLRGFLSGLAKHLEPGGEGWLILSDLAEHLGLRSRAELLGLIEAGGLKVLSKMDIRPKHPKLADTSDPLHAARAAEVTSLWRLGAVAG
jgi:methylase of polypeptide subunit release factors